MSSTAFEWKPAFEPLAFARQWSACTAQKPLSLAEIQEGVRAAGAHPLARASTLPAQAYTSGEFFGWEIEHLLRPGWQCVGHVSQIPTPGDFLNLDLLGEPLILVRGKDDAVRVLSRAWQSQRGRGMAACTMTPEFGPDGYLHAAPFTGVPVADLDQINAWMGARLRHQFGAFAAARMVESVGGT